MIKKCQNPDCERMFTAKSNRQHFCCRKCREKIERKEKRLRKSYVPEDTIEYAVEKETPKKSHIDEINKKAREMGVSYGIYQAIKSGGLRAERKNNAPTYQESGES